MIIAQGWTDSIQTKAISALTSVAHYVLVVVVWAKVEFN